MADLTSLYKNQPLRDRTIQACFDYIERTYIANYKQVSRGKFTDFFDIQGGTQPPKSHFIHEEKPNYTRFLQIRDFASDSTPTFIPIAKSNKTCIKEDVLLGRYGASVGKILTGKSGAYNVACAKVVIEPEVEVSTEFLFYLLHSSRFQNAIRAISRSAQGGFNKVDLSRIDVSFPDFERQNRVVEVLHHVDKHLIDGEALALDSFKMDEFSKLVVESIATPLSIVTDVEAANKTIQDSLDYLTKLRQALLREAMQGQLLPQDPTDEPAALLLKKLQEAKAATGKGGKGKAGTLFVEEAESVEGPFAIPESWEWCTLGEATYLAGRIGWKGLSASEYKKEGPLFISVHSLNYGDYVNYSPAFHISQERYDESPEIMLAEGDILICKDGAGIGKLGVIKDLTEPATINSSLLLIRSIKGIVPKYLYYYLLSDHFQRIVSSKIMGATTPHLYQRDLVDFPAPLPPIAEQHRIVAKLEQLMQHCDALEQRIRESRRLAEQLLATALREALAPPAGTEPAEAAEPELAEVEAGPTAPRRGRPLKKRLAANGPDLFSELADVLNVE